MEGPYVQELNAKRSGLTFNNRRVEAEYQAYAATRNNGALRIQLLLGALLICAVSLLDVLFLDPEFVQTALTLRGAVIMPPILMMFALTYIRGGSRYLQSAGILVALSVGITSLIIAAIGASYDVPRVFAGYQILIVFVYFFLGLRVPVAIATAMTLFLALMGAAIWNGASPVTTSYNALYILFLNVIGAMGSLQLSRARRLVFLEERIMTYRANHDALTQLPNRRAFDEFIENNWKSAEREGKSITLLMMDIDHFKAYNDLYGHQAGDHAISEVGKILGNSLQRPQDFAGRYGGEEFVVLLYDATKEYALQFAESIREKMLKKNIDHRGSSVASCVTLSIGLAHLSPATSNRSMKGFMQMADEALYAAKEQGRNCVVDSDLSVRATSTGMFRVMELDDSAELAKMLD